MIVFIHGSLAEKNLPFAIIETGGIGYKVEVSLFTFEQLPEPGENIRILTQQVIREDAHLLYGFANEDEKSLFVAMTKVSGFGPRLAMSMLSANRPHELAAAIRQGDKAMLQKIPGIGAKSADRLIIELRDKIGDTVAQPLPGMPQPSNAFSDAEAALVHLGYKQAEVSKVMRTLDPQTDTATLVRLALRHLSARA